MLINLYKDSNEVECVVYLNRMSQGNHHHFVWLRPEAQTEVLIPISPHIELGSFDITLELSSQVR